MIRGLWDKVGNLGIESTINNSDARRTRIFNRISFLTLCALIVPLIYLFLYRSPADLLILVIIIVLEIALILNYFGHTTASKFVTFLSITIAVTVHLVCFGNNYALSFSYVCMLALTYSFLNNNFDRTITGIFIILCYLAVRIFLFFNDPIIYMEENIVKNDFTFLLVSVICLTSLGLYITENTNQMRENKSLVNELKEKNDALENAYKDLESFTYIASHDLKTPVRTVNSFLSLIQSKTASSSDSELKEYVGFAKRGATKMTQLIQDILNYSKIEKEAENKSELLDLNEVVREIRYIIKGQEKYEHCKISNSILPVIIANRTSFHQLFQNIIENGLKYNDSSIPEVKVHTEVIQDILKFSFTDNGIGIEEAYLEQVFNPFKRLHTDEIYEGTGIGLAICKRIVENLNGNISMHSVSDEGSSLSFSIPVKAGYLNGQKVYKTV